MSEKLRKILESFKLLGVELHLTTEGPGLKMTRELDKDEMTMLRELRMVAVRNRDEIIRDYFKENPDDFRWVPVEGTEERKWYDRLVDCASDKHPMVYVGESGRKWHSLDDARRLLTSCRNSVQWKEEARRFWWDTTNAVSCRADDYDFPGG